MPEVIKEGVLLEPTHLGFENEGVFNPACIKRNGEVHMFYRAVRRGNYSSIGRCIFDGPLNILQRDAHPVLFPRKSHESQGLEDPRITQIDDQYFMTFSVYDGVNVFGAYATSDDLVHFKRGGVITPKFTYQTYRRLIECNGPLNEKYLFHYKIFAEHGLNEEVDHKLMVWDKNILLFPKKFNGKYAMLHRIHPGIQIVYFNDVNELTEEFWEDHIMNLRDHIVMDPELYYESSHIGGGCPPIETDAGWLLIYHAAEFTPHGLIYHASAALLDIENPGILLGRLSKPLFSPEFLWEKEGIVRNVVFPTGTALFDDDLYIYYGAADTRVAVAKVRMSELLETLKKSKPK